MSGADRRAGRRRRAASYWPLVAAVALVAIAGVAVARVWFFDDDARAVPTDEVVERFRESVSIAPSTTVVVSIPPRSTTVPVTTPSTTGPSAPTSAAPTSVLVDATPRLPELGVYRYVTTGAEEIDAVGGARHEYPSETTITVTPAGCGVRLQWDALRERREVWGLCIGDRGIELQPDAIQYHEFLSQPQQHEVVCDGTALLVPVDTSGRPSTARHCTVEDEPWFPTWDVLGWESRVVDAREVEVVHVRTTVRDDDEYWETTTIDWYLTVHGLPVEVHAETGSKTPTLVGDVTYREQYDLSLVSLTPLG